MIKKMEENFLTNEEEQEIFDIIEDDVNLDIEAGLVGAGQLVLDNVLSITD